MIFLLFIFAVLLSGFFHFRFYVILLLLNLEGLILVYMSTSLFLKVLEPSFVIFSMILISIAVLEAAIGLCVLILLLRYFRSTELNLMQHLKI